MASLVDREGCPRCGIEFERFSECRWFNCDRRYIALREERERYDAQIRDKVSRAHFYDWSRRD